MSDYQIITEKFEGPLDLLMHLIEKDKLDIYDIPIAKVTEQYMAYIAGMQEFDIEIASEFLLMAAILLQIKSRMLLPKKVSTDEVLEEGEQDPRQELIERLTTYRQFKIIGDTLLKMWEDNAFHFVRSPLELEAKATIPRNLTLDKLLASLANLIDTDKEVITYIENEEIHVKDKITDILNLLKAQKGQISLQDTLIRSGSKVELLTAFLAVLELLKSKQIKITQPEKFGTIYLYFREGVNVL